MRVTYYATVPLVGSVAVSWEDEYMTDDEATDKAVEIAGAAGFEVELKNVDPDPEVAPGAEVTAGDKFDASYRYHNRGDFCLMPVGEARLDDREEQPDE